MSATKDTERSFQISGLPLATRSPECGENRSKVPLSFAETSLLLIRSRVWIRFDILAVCCRSFEKIAGLKRGPELHVLHVVMSGTLPRARLDLQGSI